MTHLPHTTRAALLKRLVTLDNMAYHARKYKGHAHLWLAAHEIHNALQRTIKGARP